MNSSASAYKPLEFPTYTFVAAAHYLRMPLGTLRAWVRGQLYQTREGKKFSQPLIKLPDLNKPFLSFINLVEAHVLYAIRRQHQVKLPKVRAALDYLEKHFNSAHPLAEHLFQTDGLDLFIEHYGELINLSKNGQLAMKELLKAYLQRIERTPEGSPISLYPFTTNQAEDSQKALNAPKIIKIDPKVSFGKPVIVGTGIPTEIIFSLYQAGDTIARIAEEYDRPQTEIEEAIRFESRIAA